MALRHVIVCSHINVTESKIDVSRKSFQFKFEIECHSFDRDQEEEKLKLET